MASGGASVMQRCTVAARWLIRGASSETPCASSAGVTAAPIVCGRGDKKTKKGKRFKGSYGKSRPKREQMIERIKDKVEVPRSTPWPLPFKLIWFHFIPIFRVFSSEQSMYFHCHFLFQQKILFWCIMLCWLLIVIPQCCVWVLSIITNKLINLLCNIVVYAYRLIISLSQTLV